MKFSGKSFALVTAALLTVAAPALAAETYTLDPNHTNIVWNANHFGFSNPDGKFASASGTVTLDKENPANSKVEVSVATGAVVTGIPKFDEHLRGADFFDAEKFPTATFVSDKVEVTGENTAQVHGTLTLLGVAKPLVLDVKLNQIGENPMSKNPTVGFSATTVIKRSEFGMNYAVPHVSDEVQIRIEAEAFKSAS